MAAHGGFNHVEFLANGEIVVRPITMPQESLRCLNARLMLFYTGVKRTASTVAASYVNGIKDRRRELRIMQDLVKESLAVLSSGKDLSIFGELMHEAWLAKRRLSDMVSNPFVDEIYENALAAGAGGGKLLGAGGGGFMLLFVPPQFHEQVKQRLHKLIWVPFRFEFNGSQIIFLDHEEDFSDLVRVQSDITPFRELVETSD